MTAEAVALVDPSGLVQFLDERYLQGYIQLGGAKFKLVVGREGCGKTALLREVLSRAAAMGYAVAQLSARTTQLGRFDHFYRAILTQVDVESIVTSAADALVHDALGFALAEAGDIPFVSWAERKRGLDRADVVREISLKLGQTYRERALSPGFASAFVWLIRRRLLGGSNDQTQTVLSWLSGQQPLNRAALRDVGIYKPMDNYAARHALRSLLHVLRTLGLPGMVVAIDDLDQLTLSKRAVQGVYYTKQAKDQAYESIRQFIDDADLMPGFLLLCAGRDSVLHDGLRGIPSYVALRNRLVDEVQASEINRFSDVLNLDEAWGTDGGNWPAQRDRLIEVWTSALRRTGQDLPHIDKSAFTPAGLDSPVGRLVRYLRGEGMA